MTDEMTPVDNNTDTSQPQGDSAYVTHQSSGMTQPITWTDLDPAASTTGPPVIPHTPSVEFQTAPQSSGLTPAQVALDNRFIAQLKSDLKDNSLTDDRLCSMFLHIFKQRPLYDYAKKDEIQGMRAFARRVRKCVSDLFDVISEYKNALDNNPLEYISSVESAASRFFLKHLHDRKVPKDEIDVKIISWFDELNETDIILASSKVSNEEMRVFFESAAEMVRRCKDSAYLAMLYKMLIFIASRNQNIYPFTFLCAPSGSGKTALAYSLAADKYPTIYTVYSTDWARDRCQPVYQPFRLISTTMKKVINADLDVICGPSDTIERDYRKVNCEKLFNTDLMEKPLRTVHFFVQLFTDLLRTKQQGKYSTWMQAQVSIDQLLNGECSLEQGIQLLKNLKTAYNIGKNDPLFVFVDECILNRDNDGNIKKAEAAEVVFLRTILRILKVFPIFAGTDARTSNFITQTAISSSYSKDCPIWALVINALPQFNVEYLAEQCKHIMEKFGQHPSICSLLKFLTTTSTYENPMLIQHALDFIDGQSVDDVFSQDRRLILHRMVCSIFNEFQIRKQKYIPFTKSQFSYLLSRQWEEETLVVMKYGETSIHRHLAYLDCVPYKFGLPFFLLKLDGSDQYYVGPRSLKAPITAQVNQLVTVSQNDNGVAHNVDDEENTDDDSAEQGKEKIVQLIQKSESEKVLDEESLEDFLGLRAQPNDPAKQNPPKSAFCPKGVFPSFADAPLTGLTLFGVDVSQPYEDILEPPFQEGIAGHDPAFPRISSLDASITRCFDYHSIARGYFLESVYNAAVIMASRGNGPNGCTFSSFLVYFIKELWTVRKRDFKKGVSDDYPVRIPNLLFGDQKHIFDNKSIPFLSPMPVTEWSLPTIQLMKDSTQGKCRLGSFMFSTVNQKVDHIAFEFNYDHVQPASPDSQISSEFEPPAGKIYNNLVKEGTLDLNTVKEISLVGECKQWNRNLTLLGIKDIVDGKFKKLHQVAPFKKFLVLDDGEKPNYAKWCKTFIILTLSISIEEDPDSLRAINDAKYYLWQLAKRENDYNTFTVLPYPNQTSRFEDCRDVVVIPMSAVVGFNFAERLFVYDQPDSSVSSTNQSEPPVEEGKKKKLRRQITSKIKLVPFDDSLAPLCVEMRKQMSPSDLQMIGLLSADQIVTQFNNPHRWGRLIMVDGALVGELNVYMPTEQGEVFKPQVSVFIVESARRKGYARYALDQATQFCRNQKLSSLYASIDTSSFSTALLVGKLLEKCGFNMVQELPDSKKAVFQLEL